MLHFKWALSFSADEKSERGGICFWIKYNLQFPLNQVISTASSSVFYFFYTCPYCWQWNENNNKKILYPTYPYFCFNMTRTTIILFLYGLWTVKIRSSFVGSIINFVYTFPTSSIENVFSWTVHHILTLNRLHVLCCNTTIVLFDVFFHFVIHLLYFLHI